MAIYLTFWKSHLFLSIIASFLDLPLFIFYTTRLPLVGTTPECSPSPFHFSFHYRPSFIQHLSLEFALACPFCSPRTYHNTIQIPKTRLANTEIETVSSVSVAYELTTRNTLRSCSTPVLAALDVLFVI